MFSSKVSSLPPCLLFYCLCSFGKEYPAGRGLPWGFPSFYGRATGTLGQTCREEDGLEWPEVPSSLPEPLLSSLCPFLWTLLGGRMRTGQLGQGHWARVHAQAPVQGQGCCGLVRQVRGADVSGGDRVEALFLRLLTPSDQLLLGQVSTCTSTGNFSVKQGVGQDHGWLATLCTSAQRDLTIPPVGPVIERNPAGVQCLT